MAKLKKKNFIYAVGRRKTASARIRLFKGKGETTVNGMPIEKYFVGRELKHIWERPFLVTETSEKYYATIKVYGGGKIGQAEASAHGVSRALSEANKDIFKPLLRKAGLLTRDDRIRERRKVGMGGK